MLRESTVIFFQGGFARVSLANIKTLLLLLLAASLPLEHAPVLRYVCVGLIFLLGLGEVNKLRWGHLGWLAYPALAWVGLSLASLLWSVAPNLTERHWFSDVLVPVLALLGICSCRGLAAKLFKPCLMVFTWILFLTAVGYLFKNQVISYYYSGVGISSTLALIVIPFWLGLLRNSNVLWRWIATWHVLMLLAVGWISGNRMFWVVLLVVFLIFIFLYYSLNIKKMFLLGLAGLLLALMPLYFIYLGRSGAGGGFQGFGNMFVHDARFVIWDYWLSLAWKMPWLGIGFGRGVLNYFYGGLVPSELLAIDRNIVQHGHNIFLDVFVQLGFVGLLIYSFLVVALLCKVYRYFRSSHMDMFWAAPFLSVLAVLLKNQTDDFLIFATPVATMFFLGMALAYSNHFVSLSKARLE